jgi:hypothetical protein
MFKITLVFIAFIRSPLALFVFSRVQYSCGKTKSNFNIRTIDQWERKLVYGNLRLLIVCLVHFLSYCRVLKYD